MNNGIAGYVDYFDEKHKIPGGCLAVGMMAMRFFYMEKEFYAGQFTKRAIPKGFSLTRHTAQYFISILNKHSARFLEKLVRDFETAFANTIIRLPVKNGAVDFEGVERFMEALEKRSIKGLEYYLQNIR